MAAAVVVPFLHPVLLLVAVVGTAAAALLLPPARWRPWAALAAGPGAAAAAGLAGLVPWTGGLHLAAHGLFMALGFLLGGWLIWLRAPRIGMDRAQVFDLVAISLVAGVVGARARHVWEHWDAFARDPQGRARAWNDILVLAADVDGGGAVWYGGLILATVAVLAWARWRRIALLPLCDLVAPGVLVGLAIGRIGCFFNGCCYGAPTSLPWAVACPEPPHQPVHPAQLYETLACLLLAALLWWRWPHRRSDGVIAFWAVAGYGCWRFLNETLRGDLDVPRVLGLTPSQAISLGLVAGALLVAGVRRWRAGRARGCSGGVDIDKQG